MASSYQGPVTAAQVFIYIYIYMCGCVCLSLFKVVCILMVFVYYMYIQVGSYFVTQYYKILKQQPELVHQFYSADSIMVRIDGDSTQKASEILVNESFFNYLL